jgi:hypothetical protein
VETLPEKDRPLGRQAADKFASQCSHLSKVTFDLSLPKRVPRDDKYFDRYFSMNAQDRAKLEAEYKERDKDRAQKTDALVKQIFAAEDEIKRCLLSVT